VSDERADQGNSLDLYARRRAYESVRAVLSEVDGPGTGAADVRDVAGAVLDESGVDGLAEVTVELSLKLASALERIAGDQGLAAIDLVDVWFVDGPAGPGGQQSSPRS
jgi:hypothetical protein